MLRCGESATRAECQSMVSLRAAASRPCGWSGGSPAVSAAFEYLGAAVERGCSSEALQGISKCVLVFVVVGSNLI